MSNEMEKVNKATELWEEKVVKPRLGKFKLKENQTKFYTPKDIEGFNFLDKVGYPGTYPYTAGNDPVPKWQAFAAKQAIASTRYEWGSTGGSGAGKYAGFGTPEDYRDYLLRMHKIGRKAGPNFAFDLPTQCGYDSDDPRAEGEVGKVGVAIDSLKDFEIVYEAYHDDLEIDKVASNFTMNSAASVIIAMYAVLAEKRGIPLEKLRGTPQNDILKEYVGRGTYIFPPRPALRLFRDTALFCTKNMPRLNVTSIGGYHMREAGATREMDLAYSMAIGATYLQVAIDGGLDIDEIAPRVTFNGFGGSMEIYQEIAFQRAARRMWAKMLKERFGAKNPRGMMIRQISTAHIGCSSTTLQRPLNNISRAVVGGIAAGMSGALPFAAMPPYDEPLGLGHSLEAQQLGHDATRILIYEAKLGEVNDPWAGSYFMEKLTDDIEKSATVEFEKIEKMGGALGAIESGYMQKSVSRNAYVKQRKIENQEEFVVGVNCFNGPNEIDVKSERSLENVYPSELKDTAGVRKIESLKKLKEERDNDEVKKHLASLKEHAGDEEVNLMPDIINCVRSYATLQEICDTLRGVFGVAKASTI